MITLRSRLEQLRSRQIAANRRNPCPFDAVDTALIDVAIAMIEDLGNNPPQGYLDALEALEAAMVGAGQ